MLKLLLSFIIVSIPISQIICDTSNKKYDVMIKPTFAQQFFTLNLKNFELNLFIMQDKL